MGDFETECRDRFQTYCDLYREARFHSLKRKYVEKAYGVIDDYLAWREIDQL